MSTHRFTVFVDACTLAGALKRNLLLTLAEADLFRIRWSEAVLVETQSAIHKMLAAKNVLDAERRAVRARRNMEAAFDDAIVADYAAFLTLCEGLPDPGDAHVVAAALKTQADMIVTDNVKHFPLAKLAPLQIRVSSSDAFLADTVALDVGRAVAALRTMRVRLKRPDKTAERLLLDMEAVGLTETAEVLRPHVPVL